MDCFGYDLFARARLTGNQNRQIGRRDPTNQLHYFDERCADANKFDVGSVNRRRWQLVTGTASRALLDPTANGLRYPLNIFDLKRLHQVVISA